MGRGFAAEGVQHTRISIHPSRVGWDASDGTARPCKRISIHPSRVGWDVRFAAAWFYDLVISIHPSRVGWDADLVADVVHAADFNPPIPCGMGQCDKGIRNIIAVNFNPPIPCGMGRGDAQKPWKKITISIHPSRVGWDKAIELGQVHQSISIHPSRVGWDSGAVASSSLSSYFNPPIPCGMGHRRISRRSVIPYFNPPIPCGMGRQKIYDYIHFLR